MMDNGPLIKHVQLYLLGQNKPPQSNYELLMKVRKDLSIQDYEKLFADMCDVG